MFPRQRSTPDRRHDRPASPDVEGEARDWIVRLTSGEATTADAERFRIWRAAAPAHEAAWRQTVHLWQQTGEAAARFPAALPVRRPPLIGRRAFLGGSAVAASAALAGLGAVRLGLLPSPADLLADHATGTGERRSIGLADGSQVDLDARTALDVDIAVTDGTFGHRRLALHHGAAMFTIAGGEALPAMQVAAGAGSTTTPGGARFALRHLQAPDDDPAAAQVRVVCIDGALTVTAGNTVMLTAGQATDYGTAGCGPAMTADIATETAWQRGLLVFRDRRVDAVIAEVNRYRPGRVILIDDAAAARRISGVFHLDRPDEVVAHLQQSLGLPRRRLPAGLVVLG